MSDLWDTAISGNINEILKKMQDRLTALERRDITVEDISAITPQLGEMAGGADTQGEELADDSWSEIDMADISYTTPRMLVEEGDLVEMTCTVGYGSVTSGGGYIKVQWYDDPAAGSLIAEDRFRTFSYTLNADSLYGGTFRAPAGAQSFCIDAFVDRPAGVQSQYQTYIYKFHACVVTYAMRLALDEVARLDVDGRMLRLAAGARRFPAPGPAGMIDVVLVGTATGNLTNGFTQYAITWVDSYGETTPAFSTDAVTIDATHKQAIVYRPPVPPGVTSWRLYRKSEDTDEYQLVATIPSATASYTDNIASANLGDAPPEENTTLARPVLPTYHNFKLYEFTGNKSLTRQDSSSQNEGEYWNQASAGDGDWFRAPGMLLEPGRYTVTVLGVTANNRGKLDWYLAGQLLESGQEWYSSTTTVNVEKTISIFVEEPGWYELMCVVNGKHASSSNYYIGLTGVRLERTGR